MRLSNRVADFSLSLLVVVRRIRDAGPAELPVHIFRVRGRRMFVVLVCSCRSNVRSGAGQRYPAVLRVSLLVKRPYSWAAALTHSRYTTPIHATPPTHPPQIPSVLVGVGAGQGVFFVLAGGAFASAIADSGNPLTGGRHILLC